MARFRGEVNEQAFSGEVRISGKNNYATVRLQDESHNIFFRAERQELIRLALILMQAAAMLDKGES